MRIFEYHKFGAEPDEYQYSRTFAQFEKDLSLLKPDDIIRFDDGWAGQFEACHIAEQHNVAVVLGITTDFVGKSGYMTWDQIRTLSQKHVIANHSRAHGHLDEWDGQAVLDELAEANNIIYGEIGHVPAYYLPTYNYVDQHVRDACEILGMEILDPVIIMYNV